MTTYQTRGALALETLGEPNRRLMFELLVAEPRTVGALADVLPISRPAVSQHLKLMLDRGLVRATPVGTRRVYAVEPDAVAAMRTYLDQMWDSALASFAAAVQADVPKDPS